MPALAPDGRADTVHDTRAEAKCLDGQRAKGGRRLPRASVPFVAPARRDKTARSGVSPRVNPTGKVDVKRALRTETANAVSGPVSEPCLSVEFASNAPGDKGLNSRTANAGNSTGSPSDALGLRLSWRGDY